MLDLCQVDLLTSADPHGDPWTLSGSGLGLELELGAPGRLVKTQMRAHPPCAFPILQACAEAENLHF